MNIKYIMQEMAIEINSLVAVKNNCKALEFASQEIQNEIGNNNPIKYLESYFSNQKLNKIINIKSSNLIINKTKI